MQMGLARWASILYGVMFGITFVFAIALLSMHTVLVDMINSHSVKINVPRYTLCSLVSLDVVPHDDNLFMPLWMAVALDNPSVYVGVISNPLDLYSTRAYAMQSASGWTLNETYPCACPDMQHSDNGTGNEINACMLQLHIVLYLEQEAARYHYVEPALIAIGILSLVFSFIGFFVLLVDTECFWACCDKARKKIRWDDFHVLPNEN